MFLLKYTTVLIALTLIAGCQSSPTRISHGSSQYLPQLVHVAKRQLGRPYRYGGETPSQGFDCSGLVHYSHRQAGFQVPRTSGEQYKASKPVKRQQLRAGDLVFFRLRRNRQVSHVGIYLGNNRFIHAPASHKRVTIASLDNPYWRKHFVRGGRLLF